MTPEDDGAELRALQAKAYGRDGGLTAREADRLNELESVGAARTAPAVLTAPAEPAAAGVSSASAESAARDEPAGRDPSVDEQATDEGGVDVPPVPAPSLRGAVRVHLRAVVVAALALLLLGVGAGWAVFGDIGDAPALTAGQQERRVELQTTSKYDDGSVRLVAEDGEAVVWYATRRDGEIACIVLDVDKASQEQCGQLDTIGTMGLSVSLSVPAADPDDPADEYGTTFSAMVGYTTAGEPLAWIQRWSRDASMLAQFDGEERDRAEALLDDGFLPVPTIVGYFHDQPVWLAERPADGTQSGGIVRCMIVDAVSDVGACQSVDVDGGGGLRAVSIEPADDGTPVLWTLHIRFTNWGSPYLTIQQGEPSDVGVSYVELGGEHGDPILVEVPSSESGG
ncbi:hypothetical protein [Microbacterium maritypicum]